MTIDTIEKSVEDAAPIELYEFVNGTEFFRYTSAAQSQVFLGNLFTAAPIARSSVKDTGNFDNTTLRLDTITSLPVAQLFTPQPPSNVVALTVWRKHPTDPDDEWVVVWCGRFLDTEFRGHEATLNCEPLTISLKASAPRRPYSKNCPLTLYDEFTCKADRESFKVEGDGTVVSGSTISIVGAEAKPDNWFAGGYILYTNSVTGQLEFRGVESSLAAGGLLTLSFPPRNMSGTVKAFAGCDHTVATCTTKFDNLPRYGGQPLIPTKNPFGGTALY
jgi:uncharacterized phage protein (TIGR02218 family)